MPTVAELERLDAIVSRLIPLANVQRGQLIEAANWNVVVESILEVARAVLGDVASDTVSEHDHIDQVGLDWLSPEVRNLLERGPLTDPISERRILDVERRIKSFNDQSEKIDTSIQSLRQRWDDLATRDIQREANLVRIDKTVSNLPNTSQAIVDVRSSLDGLRTDLQQALEMGSALIIDGEVVDLGGIINRIESVEALREGLITADGQLFDVSSFEIQLQELQNEFVAREELDDILDERQVTVSDVQIAQLEASLNESLTASQNENLDAVLSSFQVQVSADINERLADVEGIVSSAIARLEPDLRDALLEELNATISNTISDNLTSIEKEFSAQLGEVQESLTGLSAQQEEFSAFVNQSIEVLQKDVGAIDERVVTVERSLDLQATNISSFETNLNTLSSDYEALTKSFGGVEEQVAQLNKGFVTIDSTLTGFNDRMVVVEKELRLASPSFTGIREGNVVSPITPNQPVNFQTISGIGPVLNRRLVQAGFSSFEQLAEANPDKLAEILNTTQNRAVRIIKAAESQLDS